MFVLAIKLSDSIRGAVIEFAFNLFHQQGFSERLLIYVHTNLTPALAFKTTKIFATSRLRLRLINSFINIRTRIYINLPLRHELSLEIEKLFADVHDEQHLLVNERLR